MLKLWRVVCVLGTVGSVLCGEDTDPDDYDDDISDEQLDQKDDFSRWDKLFIALENSHMRQNMLLESLHQCTGGMASLRDQLNKLDRQTHAPLTPDLVSACKAQAEQAAAKLQHSLTELRREGAEREKRRNASLLMTMCSKHEARTEAGLPETDQATPGPGSFRTPASSGGKPFMPLGKEQDVTSSPDMASLERALVAIAAELKRAHLQLSRVIEQAGIMRKQRV